MIKRCGLDLEQTPYLYYHKHYVGKEESQLMSIENLLKWLNKKEKGIQVIADNLCIKDPLFNKFWKIFGTSARNIYQNYKNDLVIHCYGYFIRYFGDEFLTMSYNTSTGLVREINLTKINLEELTWKHYL